MALGNTSRASLRYKPEVTPGTISATGNHYNLRYTSDALKFAIKTVKSTEIRDDRNLTDIPTVDADIMGAIGTELSYGEFDELIEGALQGTWSTWGTGGAATGTLTATATSLVLAGAGTAPFTGAVAGQWFRVSGAAQAGNNGWFKMTALTNATTIAGTGFTAETGTTGVVMSSSRLTNGTNQQSYTFERKNSDLNIWSAFAGCCIDKMSLKMTPGEIITSQFDVIGMSFSSSTTSSLLPGTTTPSATNTMFNATANFFNLLEGGLPLPGTYARSMTINVANNLRGQKALGVMGSVGIGSGQFDANASLELYFANMTMYNKFVNNIASSISVRLSSTAGGAGYVYTFPNVKYTDGAYPTPGLNQDVVLTLPFQALLDPVTGAAMIIERGGPGVPLTP
jgi:hypothetical protein